MDESTEFRLREFDRKHTELRSKVLVENDIEVLKRIRFQVQDLLQEIWEIKDSNKFSSAINEVERSLSGLERTIELKIENAQS
ncbi:hypothetical protein [Parasegetibacter sp. NRK P23]|uniref:hypothetical protein n=1 Tax=Parasegetibacter sp. NRK P23 TaxID=2942999 RepID=UPI00204377C9|nr:hypothetical protein [Parasegetibacter sp. NRK P23]MCM5528981.1 hypothetical protein [Parasegetibacter sp. NRK P23]